MSKFNKNNKERKLEETEELKRAIAELQEKLDKVGGEAVSDKPLDDEIKEQEPTEEAPVNEESLIEEPVAEEQETYYEEEYDESADYVDYGTDESYNDDRAYEEPEEEYEEYEEPEPPVVPEPVKKQSSKQKKKKKKKGSDDDDIIIDLENVTKEYVKGVPALNNVNITVRRGEFVFIVGGSGSGKSTLIKLLLRELKPTSGHIMVNGLQIEKMGQWKIPKHRRNLGVVFQDFRLLKDRDVYENVAFAQRIIQKPAREIKKNVPRMLAAVGLASKYKAKVDELSGGEQQRVAIARALVNRPPILIADEPTGNLDPKNTSEIMALLDKINQDGTTVIVVTHNDKRVNDMQKRVITIKKGIIVSDEEKGGYINEDY